MLKKIINLKDIEKYISEVKTYKADLLDKTGTKELMKIDIIECLESLTKKIKNSCDTEKKIKGLSESELKDIHNENKKIFEELYKVFPITENILDLLFFMSDRDEIFGGYFLFSWNDIIEDKWNRFKFFFKEDFDINWVENAQIKFDDNDNNAILISYENNSAKITLDNDNNNKKANLKTNDGRTYILDVIEEEGKLNIYTTRIMNYARIKKTKERLKKMYVEYLKTVQKENEHKKFVILIPIFPNISPNTFSILADFGWLKDLIVNFDNKEDFFNNRVKIHIYFLNNAFINYLDNSLNNNIYKQRYYMDYKNTKYRLDSLLDLNKLRIESILKRYLIASIIDMVKEDKNINNHDQARYNDIIYNLNDIIEVYNQPIEKFGKYSLKEVEKGYLFDWNKIQNGDLYLFNLDEIPGYDGLKLIGFLKSNYGIDLAKTAKFTKINEGRTIEGNDGKNHIYLNLKDDKLNLKIENNEIDEFNVMTEGSKIYRKEDLIEKIRIIDFIKRFNFECDRKKLNFVISQDGKTIDFSEGNRSFSFILNKEENKATLKINGYITEEFVVKNRKLYDKGCKAKSELCTSEQIEKIDLEFDYFSEPSMRQLLQFDDFKKQESNEMKITNYGCLLTQFNKYRHEDCYLIIAMTDKWASFYIPLLKEKFNTIFFWPTYIPTIEPPILPSFEYMSTLSKSLNLYSALMLQTIFYNTNGDYGKKTACYLMHLFNYFFDDMLKSFDINIRLPKCDNCKSRTIMLKAPCDCGTTHWKFMCPDCNKEYNHDSNYYLDYLYFPMEFYYALENIFLDIPYRFILTSRKFDCSVSLPSTNNERTQITNEVIKLFSQIEKRLSSKNIDELNIIFNKQVEYIKNLKK